MLGDSLLRELIFGDPKKMTVSFAGCGFLGIYHVGVASCLKEYAPHLFSGKIAGASAGSLVACGLITGTPLGEATSYTLKIAGKARSRALGPLHPGFNIVQILREGLDEFLPDNAHQIATGRLHVSLTRVSDRKNVIVNTFETKEDLLQVLVCSSFVPFYCGLLPPKYKGVRYVDGGLSDNIPLLDENTITVSPFAGESDICPNDNSANDLHIYMANTSIQFTLGNLYRFSHAFFPPHPEVLGKLCKRGFDDALKFLQKSNLISCTRHLSIQSSITTGQPVELQDIDELGDTDTTDSIAKHDLELDPEDIEIDTDSSVHCHLEGCMECRHRRHVALLDSLPPGVINALQAACDSVNSGVLAPVYNLRAYKVISLMAAPLVLPIDVMLMLTQRLYEWAPYMPSDMQWFVQEVACLVKEFVDFLQQGRHKYSARFTCQLAITETDYNQDGILSAPATPLNQRRTHRKDHYVPNRKRNLNVGFSVDFKTKNQSPLESLDELRHKILQDSHDHNLDVFHAESTDIIGDQDLANDMALEESEAAETSEEDMCHVAYDTFSSSLHIANQMESVLAFYYTEEEDPSIVKVTEIFALDDPRGPEPDLPLHGMAWDNYCEMKQEHMVQVDDDLQSLVDNFSLPKSSMSDMDKEGYVL